MQEIGWASFGVVPVFDSKKLDTDANKAMLTTGNASGTVFGNAAGKTAGSRFGTAFKSAAKAGLVGLAGLAVGAVKLAGDSIAAASDLEESTNKVSQVFGDADRAIFRFTKRAADGLGQTNTQARDAAATFGIFGKAAGFTDKQNARFAKRFTRLASDLASFNNTEPDEAIGALGAALRGESEPIRAYGVMLDEATLKAEALSLGILKPVKDQSKIFAYQTRITDLQKTYNKAVKESGEDSLDALKAEANLGTARTALQKATEGTIPPLTQQQKLLAAQSQIFKQTEVAQGDFARTSDGLANQQRRLKARFEDAKAELGSGLLPIMTDAADFLLDKGIPAFEDFSKWFRKEGIPQIKKFADEIKPAVGFAKDLAGFLKDLPSEAKLAGVIALGGAFAGSKLRGGKGGLLGSVGSAVGLAKPVPVFVTNQGFGAGGGSGVGGKAAAGAGGLLGTLGALGAFAALSGAGTHFSNNLLGDQIGDEKAGSIGLSKINGGAFGAGVITSDDLNMDEVPGRFADITDAAHKFGIEVRLNKDAVKGLVDATPGELTTKFNLVGIEKARLDAERTRAELERVRALSDSYLTTPSSTTPRGFGSDTGTGPVRRAPRVPPGGATFSGPITVVAQDTREMQAGLDRLSRRADNGGWG